MRETNKIRQIKALKINDVEPSRDFNMPPVLEWVSPDSLCIEERYQRVISARSLSLIRRIVAEFSWTRFKSPICAYGANKELVVIDGQHTAIAAASHPYIKKIPVLVVQADNIQARAEAFMGHNRDRLAITPMQLFYSSVAAQDPIAMALRKALDETGCTMVKFNPEIWQVGQTMATTSLMNLVRRRGSEGAARVLKILRSANRAPINRVEIKAVSELLWLKGWAGMFDDADLVSVISKKSADQWIADAEAKVRRGQKMALARAVAISWFKGLPKKKIAKAIKEVA